MKLKAINCKNMGAILVHQQKPNGAPTDLVAEVHSGIDDARRIAECVNAAAAEKSEAWPEDVTGPLDPTAIQGGVVAAAFNHAREEFGVIPDAVWVKPITQDQFRDATKIIEKLAQVEAQRDELLAAIETLIDGVDLRAPEGFTPDNADGVLCGRNVSVFDLIRCAEIVERVKGGAE